MNELSELIFGYVKNDFAVYGLDITKFLIENVSMPEEIKKEIFELSRLDKINLDNYTRLKAAKSMEAAAENPSGTAGMGVGLGAGMAMANQMAQSMANQTMNNQQASAQSAAVPPPLNNDKVYYVAVGGQQTGPFDMTGLKELVSKSILTKESLVWKAGMANWAKAEGVSELNGILDNNTGATPPPLPQ